MTSNTTAVASSATGTAGARARKGARRAARWANTTQSGVLHVCQDACDREDHRIRRLDHASLTILGLVSNGEHCRCQDMDLWRKTYDRVLEDGRETIGKCPRDVARHEAT